MDNTKVFVGLSNPKSPENVSSVMRAAGNFQVESIFYTGKRYPRALKLHPSMPNMSRDVSQNVPVSGVDNLLDILPIDMKVVCVEFAENAMSLLEYQHPTHAYYIFGPEDGTLSQKMINKADDVVYIPTVGCMNLAATVNVVLYDRLLKTNARFNDNKIIRLSRDTNNNLKVNR